MARILIIEDSSFTRKAIARMVKAEGYEILEATNGKEGLEKAVSDPPDCITLDLIMPEMDGIEVLKSLGERGLNIPVIVITADIQEDTRDQCLDLGAITILNKPPKEEDLRSAIKEVLQNEKVSPWK